MLDASLPSHREPTLFHARTIAIVAALVAVACACAIAPLAAFGDVASAPTPAQAAALEALDVREGVEQVNEAAREAAPPSVGARCDRTLDVEGIGDTCVQRDGLLRVEQADGRSHTIHGLDAPPVGASAFAPGSQAAVNGADSTDVTCAADGQPRYVLVYARPGDVASRYATVAPQLRSEVYKVSAFIDQESRSIDPAKGKRLPLRCDGGTPAVLNVTLGDLSSGTASFGQIVDGFRAQGFQFNGDGDGLERYVVYYDSPSPSGAAGTGHVFTTDSRGDAANQNNKGGLYAIEYRFDGGGGVPHWEVLIHEIVHTMGAIVNTAAHATDYGHCTDGLDIMCYQDAQTTRYDANVCATKVLDCNRDDYFNPSPAAGSFLATHWNTAATYNRFLDHVGGTIGGGDPSTGSGDRSPATAPPATRQPDTSAPSVPRAIRGRQVGARVTFTWRASADDTGVSRYELRRVTTVRGLRGRPTRRVLRSAGWTTRTAISISTKGLTAGVHTFQLVARDASSNVSRAATVRVRIGRDVTRPTAPRVRVGARARTAVSLSWRPSRDDVGVARYEVSQKVGRSWRKLTTLRGASRSVRVVRLRGNSSYVFRVVAVDRAGNRSAARAVSARTR